MSIVMFDAVNVSSLPAGNYAYAGYVDGKWPTYQELKRTFPGSYILSIAVHASSDADCLDIETGDATPWDATEWYLRQVKRGVNRPCFYANASTMRDVLAVMHATKVPRDTVRLWSAHYTKNQHICGPSSCGEVAIDMDGTQWTDNAMGISLDQSTLSDDFFSISPLPVPSDWQKKTMSALPSLKQGADDKNLSHWYVHRVQAILNSVYGNKLVIDGSYGPATESAVKRLQINSGVNEEGVGPETWSVIVTGSKV
jgi:hypothetical protein